MDWNRWIGQLLGRGALKIAGIRLQVEGAERLTAFQPCVYIANHQSTFDVAVFSAHFPANTLAIGKKEVRWIPLFGGLFARAGNILINRTDKIHSMQGLSRAIQKVRKENKSIWIFPEGTRNRSDQPLLPFKKGAFHLALEAKVPIVPIVCEPLQHLVSWKHRRIQSGTLKLHVLPPLPPSPWKRDEAEAFSHQARSVMLEALARFSPTSQ